MKERFHDMISRLFTADEMLRMSDENNITLRMLSMTAIV